MAHIPYISVTKRSHPVPRHVVERRVQAEAAAEYAAQDRAGVTVVEDLEHPEPVCAAYLTPVGIVCTSCIPLEALPYATKCWPEVSEPCATCERPVGDSHSGHQERRP